MREQIFVDSDSKGFISSPPSSRFTFEGQCLPEADHSSISFAMKRVVDVSIASALLLLLSPLLLLIALAIRGDSRGPVLFVQPRVGARRRVDGGRCTWEVCTFAVYKFRSMYHGADQALHRNYIKAFVAGQEASEVAGSTFKLDHDPRVTRVGRVLRRTSLDELPQLLNVIEGTMSLVGPRPVPAYEVADYESWHYERLAALPGITGLWQVRGRGRVTFDEMMRMDIEYVRNQSLWLDLKLLALTLPAVFLGRGAR